MMERIIMNYRRMSAFPGRIGPACRACLCRFWIRLFAFLLDGVVIGSINNLAVSPVFSLLNLPKESGFFTFSLYSFVTAAVFLLTLS